MPAVQPRRESADSALPATMPAGAQAQPLAAPGASPAARLADELAVPAPSPVHQLQAELAQLTAPADSVAEPLYPGWFRLGFPLVVSALLWAAILWGVSRLA